MRALGLAATMGLRTSGRADDVNPTWLACACPTQQRCALRQHVEGRRVGCWPLGHWVDDFDSVTARPGGIVFVQRRDQLRWPAVFGVARSSAEVASRAF